MREPLSHAVDLIENSYKNNGRLIITGVGKSGHVGKKIAATFSSCGQPSYFMNSNEALHGDLGLVTDRDVLLCLSYSGTTVELLPIIEYTKHKTIPIISITGNNLSFLSLESTISLVLPRITEACHLGLAPTTSTILMMSLGDALSQILLKERQFSENDFKRNHPKGNLGFQLTCVKKVMHKIFPLVTEDESMQKAILTMTSFGFGCVGVINNTHLVGIITDGDLRRHMDEDLLKKKAKDVMSFNPKTLYEDEFLKDALEFMQRHGITNIFIINKQRQAIGVLNIHDCLPY
jgi:arabinose-5-phosphate isomerase